LAAVASAAASEQARVAAVMADLAFIRKSPKKQRDRVGQAAQQPDRWSLFGSCSQYALREPRLLRGLITSS
jgi:hypothetical protein